MLTISLLWIATSTGQQEDFLLTNASPNGTSELRQLGAREPVVPLVNLAANVSARETTLAIIGPRISFSLAETVAIERMLIEGAVVLLADNYGVGTELLRSLNAPMELGDLSLLDSLFYGPTADFPVVYNISVGLQQLGLDRIMLNRAVPLVVRNTSLVTILADTSPFSFLDANSNGRMDAGETRGPFPVLASFPVGLGTLYVLSSPGVFTNGMLPLEDNLKLVDFLLGEGRKIILVDQEHLAVSSSTGIRMGIQRWFTAMAEGTFDRTAGFVILITATFLMATWIVAPTVERRQAMQGTLAPQGITKTVDQLMHSHPTWDRKRLDFLQRELDLMKTRRRSAE